VKIKLQLILIAAGVFFLSISFSVYAVEGEVVYIDGFAWINRGVRTIDVDFGAEVLEQDIVETDAGSLVIIRLAKGRELKLRENTVLEINELDKNTTVELKQGSVFSKVSRGFGEGFSVRTRSVVAGVRGTEFFIAYGKKIDVNPDVWLCVREGEVEVSIPETGEAVIVEEGKGINIVGGETLTKPQRYPWTLKLNWNMDPDTGELEDTTDLNQAYEDLLDQDYD
jgi:ferric-dicitrate binding protein FerR (iron transport regulator)